MTIGPEPINSIFLYLLFLASFSFDEYSTISTLEIYKYSTLSLLHGKKMAL